MAQNTIYHWFIKYSPEFEQIFQLKEKPSGYIDETVLFIGSRQPNYSQLMHILVVFVATGKTSRFP